MGRKLIALSAAVALAILGPGSAFAQSPQGAAGGRNKGHAREGHFRGLSSADRQRFNRNAERWMQMSVEERKIMRERENLRRQRIKQEAEAAIRDSGLRLEGENRAQFEARYLQERTKIEHLMRQELEAKRRRELPGLIQRLKKEFESPSPSVTPSPSASTKPGN